MKETKDIFLIEAYAAWAYHKSPLFQGAIFTRFL